MNVCFRFRLIGQMWQTNFMRIVSVNEHGVTLTNDTSHKLCVIENFNDIMQFELDAPLFQYNPHTHYDLVPAIAINSGKLTA